MDRMSRIFRLNQLFAALRYAIPRACLEAEQDSAAISLTPWLSFC